MSDRSATSAVSASTRARTWGHTARAGRPSRTMPQYADTMRLLRSWGEKTRYEHAIKGFNYRMDGIQGAILGVKLRHLEQWTEARRTRAALYARMLAGTAARTPKSAHERAACVPCIRRSPGAAGRVARASAGDGHPDGRALSDSRAPAARVSQPRVQALATSRWLKRSPARSCRLPMFPEMTRRADRARWQRPSRRPSGGVSV